MSNYTFTCNCRDCGDEILTFTVIVRSEADGRETYEVETEPHDCQARKYYVPTNQRNNGSLLANVP